MDDVDCVAPQLFVAACAEHDMRRELMSSLWSKEADDLQGDALAILLHRLMPRVVQHHLRSGPGRVVKKLGSMVGGQGVQWRCR